MRLQELYIKDYKVLQDFTLTFDEESAVSVLIGENGSGKTTVVECLTLIFAELFRQNTVSDLYKSTFPFEFRLRYTLLTGPHVGFDYEHEDRSSSPYVYEGDLKIQFEFKEKLDVRIEVDGSEVYDTPELLSQFLQAEGFSTRQIRYLLPNNVVLYYSGISKILEQIFDSYEDKMILGTLDGEMKANPDLFYFKPENFPALLIGLLSFQYGNISDQLQSSFQIAKIDSFDRIVIRVKRPNWARKGSKSQTFWGATGDLANFLAVLRDRTQADFSDSSITFIIRTRNQLSEVLSFYGQEKSLFEYLITLQANGLIEQIDVDLRKDIQLVVPYQRLSEGEKQLLIIMALRELFATDNSLFLFDEPDTFLHPTWQVKFIEELQVDLSQAIQYIITTHSPLLLNHAKADLSKVRVNQLVDGKVSAYTPRYASRDIATVLYEVMGVEERPKEISGQFNQLFSLIEDENTTDARSLLNQIAATVGADDPEIIKAQVEIDLLERLNATDNEE